MNYIFTCYSDCMLYKNQLQIHKFYITVHLQNAPLVGEPGKSEYRQ